MKYFVCVLSFLLVGSLSAKVFYPPKRQESRQSMTGLRSSSAPYISGDTFRAAADFIFDEKRMPLDTDAIKEGDAIFVKVDFVPFFFKEVHPYITNRYILISHNGDMAAPGASFKYLDDDKLIAWFGQNCDRVHPKFVPIPIGVANQYWPWGSVKNFDHVVQNRENKERPWLAYLNVLKTHPERKVVEKFFADKPWCIKAARKPHKEYLEELIYARFVICPRGNGIDCHRTWEVLLMGAIPVLKHSILDPMYEGMPVVLVNDWSEVTEAFLEKKYEEIQTQAFKEERIFAGYWLNLIKEKQIDAVTNNK